MNNHFREYEKLVVVGIKDYLSNPGSIYNLLTSLIKQENFMCCKRLEGRYQLRFVKSQGIFK